MKSMILIGIYQISKRQINMVCLFTILIIFAGCHRTNNELHINYCFNVKYLIENKNSNSSINIDSIKSISDYFDFENQNRRLLKDGKTVYYIKIDSLKVPLFEILPNFGQIYFSNPKSQCVINIDRNHVIDSVIIINKTENFYSNYTKSKDLMPLNNEIEGPFVRVYCHNLEMKFDNVENVIRYIIVGYLKGIENKSNYFFKHSLCELDTNQLMVLKDSLPLRIWVRPLPVSENKDAFR